MPEFLDRIFKTLLLLGSWYNGIFGEKRTFDIFFPNTTPQQHFTHDYHLNNHRITAVPTLGSELSEYDQSRSYYNVPAPPFIPAFDPISVLASLAFLAFLLQSFAALFDRTRSIIPTIISSRRSSSDYGQNFVDIEKRVLRALEEYASLSNDLLENEKKSKKSAV